MKSQKFLRKKADQAAAIIKLAETANNGEEIANSINLSSTLVYKVLKANNISLNDNRRNRVIEYAKSNKNKTVNDIANTFNLTRERIRQILVSEKIELNPNTYFYTEEEIQKAKAKLVTHIDTLIKNGKLSLHGCPDKGVSLSMQAYLRKHGFNYSKEFQKLRDSKILEMSHTMTPAEITKTAGLSYMHVLHILHKNGLKKSSSRAERNKSIRKDLESGISTKEIATNHNVSRETVLLIKGNKRTHITYKS